MQSNLLFKLHLEEFDLNMIYHLIMYLEANGIKIEDIIEELSSRKK